VKKGKEKKYPLRIEAKLVKPLEEKAQENRRSINGEINAAIENHISDNSKTTK
jgi:hypothetical protein